MRTIVVLIFSSQILVHCTMSPEIACQKHGVECVGSPSEAAKNMNTTSAAGTAPQSSDKPPGVAALTLDECKERLADREQGFYAFSTALDKTKGDTVPRVQQSLVVAEEAVLGILKRQTDYSSELIEVNKLIQSGTDRAQTLLSWEKDETSVRGQLRILFDKLEKEVLADGQRVSDVSKTLRDSVRKMQVMNDKTSQIMIKVADAQTATYQWAYNATQMINLQTRRVAGLAEELKVRDEEVGNAKIVTNSLLKLLTEITETHPEAQQEANKLLTDDTYFQSALSSLLGRGSATVTTPSPSTPTNTTAVFL